MDTPLRVALLEEREGIGQAALEDLRREGPLEVSRLPWSGDSPSDVPGAGPGAADLVLIVHATLEFAQRALARLLGALGPQTRVLLVPATAPGRPGPPASQPHAAGPGARDLRSRPQAEILHTLLDRAADVLLVYDPLLGRLVYANEVATRVFRRPASELIGMEGERLLRAVHPEDVPRLLEALRGLLRRPPGPISIDLRALVGGHTLPCRLVAHTAPDAYGGLVITGMVRDLSEAQSQSRRYDRRLRTLRGLERATWALLEADTPEAALARLAIAARDLTGARLALAVYGSEEGPAPARWRQRSQADDLGPAEIDAGRLSAYLDLVRTQGSVRLTQDELVDHPEWWGRPMAHDGLDGLLAVGLAGARPGEVGGMVLASHKEGGAFAIEDEALLARLAGGASRVLLRLAGSSGGGGAPQVTSGIRTLHEASRALLGEVSVEGVLARTCELAVEQVGQCTAWIGLVDEGSEEVTPRASSGPATDLVGRLRIPLTGAPGDDRPVARAIRSGATVSSDLSADPTAAGEWRSEALPHGYRALCALPLHAHGRVAGVLAVYYGQEGGLPPDQVQTLESLANLAAAGLEKATLHAEAGRYAVHLEERIKTRTSELVASESRFRAVFDHAPVGMLIMDAEGRMVAANAAFWQVVGRPDDDLARLTIEDILPEGADLQRLQELCNIDDLGDADLPPVPVRFARGDGETREGQVRVSVACDADGRPEFAVVMLEDVTEAARTQAALLQAERLAATGTLAAALAHEIRNPLQSVIGGLGLAAEDLGATGKDTTFLNVALDEVKRVSRLLGQFRDVHRPLDLAGRQQLDVVDLVESVVTLVAGRARDQDVQIEVQASRPVEALVWSEGLQQVLLNLVLNALDAMPGGGRLTVGAAVTHGSEGVLLTVRDTGAGIPPDLQTRVFQPFFSTKREGSGLGLYVCQQIVVQHGGSLDFSSEPGAGTTFRLWIPRRAAAGGAGADGPAG